MRKGDFMSEFKVQNYDVEEIQDKIFSIFLEFDRVCKKNNLSYTLEGGSLLGAVLYQDFIPWDDDMDIIMLRKDYEKFCEIVNNELSEKYVFENMYTNKEYPFLFGKIFDKTTIYRAKNLSHLNIEHGVFLDIFVEDKIKPSTKKIHSRLVAAVGTVKYIKLKVEKFRARHILYAPLFLLSNEQLNKLADYLMKYYENKETGYVYPLCQSINVKPPLPMRLMTEFVDGKFHGFDVKIPKCHMWYLHKHYETPMEIPPKEKQYPTHGVEEVRL